MTNSKTTKRALLSSVLAIVLCLTMLIGTTFAWFTDTASTGVNKIVSGNLDVDIVGATTDDHVEKLNFTKAEGATEEEILWEPGCRYLTEGFRIANNGNLALKWKVQVNKGTTAANEGNYDLLDVIDFYLVTGTDDEGTLLDVFDGNLKKDETSDVYYIKGVMQTTAGNEYQNLTLDGITITVYATQDTVESDSFNDQYDANALYDNEIATAEDLAKFIDTVAANKGEYRWESLGGTMYYRATAELTADIDMSEVEWNKELKVNEYSYIVIDGKGHSIKNLTTTGGLFGDVGISSLKSTVTVQNLTIDGAQISGKDYGFGAVAGAFAGKGGAVKYIDCKVVNSTISSSKYAGGFVGYDATGGSTPLEAINCAVENTSVTVLNSAADDSGSAGGICGYTQSPQNYEGVDVKDDVTVTVTADRAYAGRYIGTVNAAVTLKNCAQQTMEDSKLAGRVVSGAGQLVRK